MRRFFRNVLSIFYTVVIVLLTVITVRVIDYYDYTRYFWKIPGTTYVWNEASFWWPGSTVTVVDVPTRTITEVGKPAAVVAVVKPAVVATTGIGTAVASKTVPFDATRMPSFLLAQALATPPLLDEAMAANADSIRTWRIPADAGLLKLASTGECKATVQTSSPTVVVTMPAQPQTLVVLVEKLRVFVRAVVVPVPVILPFPVPVTPVKKEIVTVTKTKNVYVPMPPKVVTKIVVKWRTAKPRAKAVIDTPPEKREKVIEEIRN